MSDHLQRWQQLTDAAPKYREVLMQCSWVVHYGGAGSGINKKTLCGLNPASVSGLSNGWDFVTCKRCRGVRNITGLGFAYSRMIAGIIHHPPLPLMELVSMDATGFTLAFDDRAAAQTTEHT